ncbi:MAG: lipopolysaccharide heptosyltransferase II [Armatimonadota bacterium]|nr:lipopolysaccharide heptosyltransferase II [Armatimonadota bacterium]
MNIAFVRFVDRNVGIPLCYILGRLGDRRILAAPSPEQVRRVAVLKFVGVGNLVMASPTLASLRQHFTGARITFVTLSNNRRLLENNGDVDDIFYFDAANLGRVLVSTWRLLRHLRRGGYDLVVDLEPFSRYTALVSFLSGARWRVGFDSPTQARGALYNLPVPYTNDRHMVEAFHQLAERVGAPRPEPLELTRIFPSLEDEAAVESFVLQHHLDPTRPMVGIHVGTGDNAPVRRWPPRRFARLADALVEEFGAQVVFTGSSGEVPLVEEARSAMSHHAASAAGRLTLPQLAALIARCSLFVSADTGPLHMAAAMRVPVVGLYGPNTPELYGPWGGQHTTVYHRLPCSPCISNLNDKLTRCPHGACIQSITVEEVLDVIRAHHGALLQREVAVG